MNHPSLTTAEDHDGAGPDSANAEGSLSVRTVRSVLWLVAQKWAVRIGGLVTVAMLARLLDPADFGLLAAASTVTTLVYVLSDLGFSTYIVQASTVRRRTLSTAFWFSLGSGLALAACIYVGAPAFAAMLGLPELVGILRVLTLSIVFIALTSVPLALLRRRMAFGTIAAQDVTAALLAQVVAVVAALNGLGVWALVLQLMTAQVVAAVFVWSAVRWMPSWEFSPTEFVVMARFGSQVVANGLVSVVRVWVETAIIVGVLGVRDLGYLNIGQRLVQAAQELSVAALFPVTTVAFSRVRTSTDRLRSAYLRSSSVAHAVVTPLMTYLAVSATVLVPLFFGSGWEASVPVTCALAAAALLTLGVTIDHGLHYGLGHPGRWLIFTTAIYTFAVAMTAFGVRYGLLGVVVGFIVVALAETIGRWMLTARLLGLGVATTATPLLRMIAPATASGLAGLAVIDVMPSGLSLLTLALAGVAVLVVHVTVVRIFAPFTYAEVVSLLPTALARRARPASQRRWFP